MVKKSRTQLILSSVFGAILVGGCFALFFGGSQPIRQEQAKIDESLQLDVPFRLSEDVGVVLDDGPLQLQGAVMGTPAWYEKRNGEEIELGSQDEVVFEGTSGLFEGGQVSVAVRAERKQERDFQQMLVDHGNWFIWTSRNRISLHLVLTDGERERRVPITAEVARHNSGRTLITGVIDLDNDWAGLYVEDELVAEEELNPDEVFVASKRNLSIGKKTKKYFSFTGFVDDIRIYDTALDHDDIKLLVHGIYPPFLQENFIPILYSCIAGLLALVTVAEYFVRRIAAHRQAMSSFWAVLNKNTAVVTLLLLAVYCALLLQQYFVYGSHDPLAVLLVEEIPMIVTYLIALMLLILVGFVVNKKLFEKKAAVVERELVEHEREENAESAGSFISRMWLAIRAQGTAAIIILAILIGGGFILRVGVGEYIDYFLDEGQLVYDAHLILEGATPFDDFQSRSPILIYALAGLEKVMGGYGIVNSKVAMALIYAAATLMFYMTLRRLRVRPRFAVLSAAIFNAFPYYFYPSLLLHVAQAFILPLLIIAYLFVRYLQTRKSWYLVATGLMVNIAYLIRRETLAYIPLIALFILFTKLPWKKRILHLGIFAAAGFALFYVVGLPFIIQLGFGGYDELMGFRSIGRVMGIIDSKAERMGEFKDRYAVLFSWFVTVFPVWYALWMSASRFIAAKLVQQQRLAWAFRHLVPLAFYITLPLGFLCFHSPGLGIYNLFRSELVAAYVVVVVGITILMQAVFPFDWAKNRQRLPLAFLAVQAAWILLFIYWQVEILLPTYFLGLTSLWLLVFLPVIAASMAHFAKHYEISRWFISVGCMVIFGALLIQHLVSDTHNRVERHVVNTVSEQVDQNTGPDEAIFTADTTLVINSHRPIIPPVTHHSFYLLGDCPYGVANLPCMSEFPQIFEDEKVNLLVIGLRTRKLIRESEEISAYVEEHFEQISEIKGIDILKRKTN